MALELLVQNARGVRIKGIKRIDCEACSKAYAKKTIQRAPLEGKSPRPYFRIAWDIFYFSQALDGSIYAVVITDEYSGAIQVFPLTLKAQEQVFGTIRRFERWVKRQYGLSICKIRQDAEAAVISHYTDTEYVEWAKQEGIDLE